jgi:hypothetical protein
MCCSRARAPCGPGVQSKPVDQSGAVGCRPQSFSASDLSQWAGGFSDDGAWCNSISPTWPRAVFQ